MFRVSAAGTFQVSKNFFGAVEDFFGQAGEASHLDAVTFVCATGDDFAQKNNLLVPFAHGDVQVADACPVFGEFGEFVIVRRKQGARFDFVVEKFGDAPRDGEPVKGGCAAADLVENNQTAGGGVIDDVGSLIHLHHERRLAPREIIAGADAGED